MNLSNTATANELKSEHGVPSPYANMTRQHASAVSWDAILAGAAAAAALSLILLMLGTGLGLSSISPWAREGVTATTLGVSTILWLTLTQLLASGMGGYLAGRLRTKWIEVHIDEVYFRDTAHGFLAWAVASLATAALMTSVIGTVISGGIQAGASVADGVATTATAMATRAAATAGTDMAKSSSESGSMNYFVDSLFRKDMAASTASVSDRSNPPTGGTPEQAASVSEVSRIFMNMLHTGPLPPEDVRYVGQLVAQGTGLSQQDAEKRVTDTYAHLQAKVRDAELATRNAADKARKAAAYTSLWLFISLLIGAFTASLMATYGGTRRDA